MNDISPAFPRLFNTNPVAMMFDGNNAIAANFDKRTKNERKAPNIVPANINAVPFDRFDSLLFQTLSRALAALIHLTKLGTEKNKRAKTTFF